MCLIDLLLTGMNKLCFLHSISRQCILALANGANNKPPHPERHICPSEDKATLIPPVGLKMELKGSSGGMCPIGSKNWSHKILLLPSSTDYFQMWKIG